ncbi:MAG: substrate-binding domain-containing protein [Caldilineaceae bacterium]
MQKYLHLLLLGFLLSGCSTFGWRQATPTPVTEEVAIRRFLAGAPVSARITATPSLVDSVVFSPPSGMALPLVEPLDVVGNITVAGSPALAPLTRLIYARFVSAGYRDTMRIEEISADAVFQRYCGQDPVDSSAVDIVMADRPIRQPELELCLQHNRQPVALRVALDTVVVVTHPASEFVSSMSKAELTTLFTARRWSAIRQGWPNREIIRIVPNEGSPAFALFVDKILDRNPLLLRNAPAATFLADGQEISMMVADTPDAVGILNFADYQKEAAGLRLLAVDGMLPNGQTVSSGAYVLTYPLLLYADLETLTMRTQVAAFLLYYLTNMNSFMARAGNFPVSEAAYERTKVVLLNALGQGSYLEQFAPTSTPAPPPTLTPTITPAITPTVVLTSTVTVTR